MGILMWILVGLIAGWLTGKIMKGSGYGFFVDILLGIAGALVGGFIARHLGLDAQRRIHLQHADRRWRRDHPGGHPSADQKGLTAGLTAHDGCLPLPRWQRGRGARRLRSVPRRSYSEPPVDDGCAEGAVVAGAAAGAAVGSRTRTAKRGKAKLPAASSITFNWQTYGPGLSPLNGTSSSIETASRPSTLIDFACTIGVSYTLVDPWISSRLLSRSIADLASFGAPSAAFSCAGS